MPHQDPTAGCSKASRGLSVLPRVARIFTRTPISPGTPPRQCGSRYAIHAGRNLPDKEFRYLRTVIVTAAVYRGFGSELRRGKPRLTPPLNLPALGRRQPLYILLRVVQRPVFLVNSRHRLVTATHLGFGREGLHLPWAPLLPKLRGQFAEFLGGDYPARLRILALPTCVGLRYGHPDFNA